MEIYLWRSRKTRNVCGHYTWHHVRTTSYSDKRGRRWVIFGGPAIDRWDRSRPSPKAKLVCKAVLFAPVLILDSHAQLCNRGGGVLVYRPFLVVTLTKCWFTPRLVEDGAPSAWI